jgi:hypothetical protein
MYHSSIILQFDASYAWSSECQLREITQTNNSSSRNSGSGGGGAAGGGVDDF